MILSQSVQNEAIRTIKPAEPQPLPRSMPSEPVASGESRSQHKLVFLRPSVAAGREVLFALSLVTLLGFFFF